MNRNQVISIRLTTDEKLRLEQACALAGFDSLGAYIRERLLPENGRPTVNENQDSAIDELTPILFGIQREQIHQAGLLALILALTMRKTTSGDLHAVETELARAQELGLSPTRLSALLAPQLNRLLNALEEI
ncbi:hypothetical protein I2492_01215 [Budviciaceae bacterium CWB-B4]|uniref:Uncharacterized protein n=1 Tax=Limnobaculum xujianqingii TaxID=2738837 RepID=A0A9D7AF81_9GAMM|nr:hypothetical protein [Limnobaculum xujianqingii]MBK5071634.1 hypothetical protein [Limnobaculum xujianqingii]MBK5174943.1 hypothetical protein [Limnobaculum xujianqingii]